MLPTYKTGLVLGKFYPPHLGHLHVIHQAEEKSIGGVIVVVGSLQAEIIPPSMRCYWLQRMVGKNTTVISIPDDSPNGKKVADIKPDDEEYYTLWRDNLVKNLPFVPTTLYGSEPYVEKLAHYMGIEHEIVDIDRKKFPVSATMIRNDPFKYWEYVPNIVKPYYVARKK